MEDAPERLELRKRPPVPARAFAAALDSKTFSAAEDARIVAHVYHQVLKPSVQIPPLD